MHIICLDVEGVLLPEIWIGVAERTGIEQLTRTTRDIPDYDELMRYRLRFVEEHKLTIQDIRAVIDTLEPLPGAKKFLDELRADYQVILLSDTFRQFATPLMRQLDWPTLFCHDLQIEDDGRISGYRLRQQDQKRKAVEALQSLNMTVIASGDSYNDASMLAAAQAGIWFRPPPNVTAEFPQYPVAEDYRGLRIEIDSAAESHS